MNADLRRLIAAARKQGWRVDRTHNSHLAFRGPPGTEIVHTGTTPGDHRAVRNLRSQLRRAGLQL